MSTQPRLHAVDGESWGGEPDEIPTLPTPNTDSAAGGTNPPGGSAGGGASGRVQKQRSDRSLPTDRLTFEKQVEVLRAIAQQSGHAKRPVTAEDVSAAIGLKDGSITGGLSNKFFRDTGWVVSAGRGAYAATEPLMEYHRHLNIDPQDTDGARRHLVAPVENSWYWDALEPILEGGARKSMVLHRLSKAAGAYEHTPQLELIVTWLEWLGMVRREGDLVFREQAGDPDSAMEGITTIESVSDVATQAPHGDPGSVPALEAPELGVQMVESEVSQHSPSTPEVDADTSALVSFSFSVRITSDDAAKLSSEQLQSVLDFAEKLRR